MKALYRYHGQAQAAARQFEGTVRRSTCDAWDDIDEIKDADLQRGGVSGEVNCYKSDNGDIAAWWEEDD